MVKILLILKKIIISSLISCKKISIFYALAATKLQCTEFLGCNKTNDFGFGLCSSSHPKITICPLIVSNCRSISFLGLKKKKIIIVRNITSTIIKKTVSPAVLLEQKKLLYYKAIFYHFCKQFERYSFDELLNDKSLISIFNEFMHNAPTLHSRAFQLALEVTYSKRKFSEKTLQEYFAKDFKINDILNMNQGVCDQSTIYNSFLAQMTAKYFNLDYSSVVVYSTPLKATLENLTFEEKKTMLLNKKLTDNTVPDVSIKERPYDFKEPASIRDFKFSRNQIYFIDFKDLKNKSSQILNSIEDSLSGCLSNPQTLDLGVRLTLNQFLSVARNYNNQGSTKAQLGVEHLNNMASKGNFPLEFKYPLLIIYKKTPLEHLFSIENKDEIEKIPLDQGHLDYKKAQKAIMGILDVKKDAAKRDIQKATQNSLEFFLSKQIEEVD